MHYLTTCSVREGESVLTAEHSACLIAKDRENREWSRWNVGGTVNQAKGILASGIALGPIG